ncbi:BlaI/MecI/CopY family transcriptional regulator [Rhodococcus sp. BP-316]|jgi:predicted transcriptional regulator|uniref:BlaI/MecI/CopY family transcriptional regulator n=1 Tax=unclassified Rhodococcus (in: high G+C Gram-positive bacteria) TaxID=192944 RepID=UPI001C9A3C33|nr:MULTISPECIES: BlaI/MecI/CopY family transcriptional regulator [unclassified Rhodococcus (in: high G+C Gram-positive bacteria)]MBY6682903.1 BlaI/MecI/CopY family transcriptional regulator [Rhodococcus sp. BP-316]MDQ1203042.1 putative transcriptional regulator [Rhodococcus sp. SORGH_AS_0303]
MRREPGALEKAVLRLLGQHDELSVSAVRTLLEDDLAHTTVMTALVRLHGKGLVTRERQGRSFVYRLTAPYEDLPALRAAMRMRSELDAGEARADVLASFVSGLDPDDELVLRELLSRHGSPDTNES